MAKGHLQNIVDPGGWGRGCPVTLTLNTCQIVVKYRPFDTLRKGICN